MSLELDLEEDVDKFTSNLMNRGDKSKDGMVELVGDLQEKGEHIAEEHDEDEDGDGEEDEGDGAYTFKFAAEIDPLSLIEDDAFGNQPYQQLERLEHEYEALAARKRITLAVHDSQLESLFTRESIEEMMNYGRPRKSRKCKKKGRRKGSKNNPGPEVTRMLGDATLHYAHGRYEAAISVLKEVVRIAPNLPDSYHTFGLIYNAMGDKKKALNFYMLAAALTPKDESLWKLLVTSSIEQKNIGQARYCLDKAISADPQDISLRFRQASLFVELKEYQKAAESYEQATMLYEKFGHQEHFASTSEELLRSIFCIVDLLAAIYMENREYTRALQHIERAGNVYCGGKELPPYLRVKEGICHAHLGDTAKAEVIFGNISWENVNDPDLIGEVADPLMALEHYESALKYYLMLEGNERYSSGFLHKKIAHCYLQMKEKAIAIEYLYKALHALKDNVDVRLTLATLLLEEDKEEEAILVLSPPKEEFCSKSTSSTSKPWWLDGRIKLKLCHIYQTKGCTEAFVDTIFPSIRESLYIETMQQKVKVRKRLSKFDLSKRTLVLDDHQTDSLFHGFRPVATSSDLSKASRAKRLLQKRKALKAERKAASLAAGLDWRSDDSDEDNNIIRVLQLPPLPNLLKDEEHHQLIIDLCRALISLQRFSNAMEIINLTLKLASSSLSIDKREELRSLGAQIADNIADPMHCWDYVRHIVSQHPQSFAAWNYYYRVVSRLENRIPKHTKFLHRMRVNQKGSIPAIVISGHQLTMTRSQHQAAASEYLQAHKLMPDSPLINLCAGSALINLALGHRVQNKHQCILQGLAFLYENLRLCESSQESLYNIARAYHHVGLVALAVAYYEKVLALRVDDYPIPKLRYETPNSEGSDTGRKKRLGYCDLRREAAHNLHLIYRNSGALDLARQILRDHCTI